MAEPAVAPRVWQPTPLQELALNRPEYEVLYGGSKFGGKSEWLLAYKIARRMLYPNSRGLIIRREIAEVTKQGALWDRAHALLGATVTYNETAHTIAFPNGSVEEFGHCQHEDDKYKYQGAQYADIGFDQLEQFTETQYSYLQGACRVPQSDDAPRRADGKIIEPRIRATANPGDVGHAWVKTYYVDAAPPGTPYSYVKRIPRPDGGLLTVERARIYLPATVFDNPYATPEYIASLHAMPEPYRSAYLYGKWDVFIGQAFVDFRPRDETGEAYHVIPYMPLPVTWRRVAGHDWGYDEPHYTLWGALDPGGGLIVYRELWGRGQDPEEIASANLMMQGGERIAQTWADPSIWAEYKARLTLAQVETLQERGQLQLSIAKQYAQAGWYMQPANNQRLAGKMAIHSLLKPRPDGVPYLRVMDSCPRLIATLTQIQLDAARPEDVVTKYAADAPIRDEPYDALRYLVMGLPNMVQAPPPPAPNVGGPAPRRSYRMSEVMR